MNNPTTDNKDEIVNALVDLYYTSEYFKKKNEEYLQQYADNHHQDIMREKWRRESNKYRENHKEQFNAYMKVKTNQYYHANKEEISKKRALKYKEKKEEKRLKELAEKNLILFKESLGTIQKIDC